jgi:peptidoglycan/LPS O-acetylase OafA/YrhL
MKSLVDSTQSLYYPWITGLRGMAILFVCLVHFFPSQFPNAFFGVDIFFVISGFVVTKSIITKHILPTKPFLFSFYTRRLSRIFPLLAVYSTASIVVFSLVNPYILPDIRTAAFSWLGLSNYYLIKTATDYFGASANLNPFLVTWYLSVDFQFYLFFPLLLICAYVCKRTNLLSTFTGILLLIFSISFTYYLSFNDQSFVYFSSFARFWQIIAGSLAFLLSRYLSIKLLNPSWIFIPKIGFLLILIFSLTPLPIQPFNTRILVVFCVMVLFSFSYLYSSSSFKFLSSAPFRLLGKISFSLYLWHWFWIVLAYWTFGLTSHTVLPLIGLSLLTSYLSYKFIESNIIFQSIVSLRTWALSTFSFLFFSFLYPFSALNFLLYQGSSSDIELYNYTPYFQINNKSDRSILVLGDSYAPRIAKSLEPFSRANNFNLYLSSHGHTNALTNVFPFMKFNTYFEEPLNLFVDTGRIKKSDILILSTLNKPQIDSKSKNRYIQILTSASKIGLNVIVIGQNPTFHSYESYNLSNIQDERLCLSYFFRPKASFSPNCFISVPRQQQVDSVFSAEQFVNQLQTRYPNMTYFRIFHYICPPSSKFCNSFDGSNTLFTERGVHLSSYAIQKFLPYLEKAVLTLSHK